MKELDFEEKKFFEKQIKSPVMLTLGTKLSLDQAKLVADIANWKRFE